MAAGQSDVCGVCLEDYKSPKFLPCHHTFCQHCLEQLVQRSGSSHTISCPKCRFKVPVPVDGVRSFQNNFYVADSHKHNVQECHAREQTEYEALCVKCAAIKETIWVKYTTLISAAKRFHDESLTSLDSVCSRTVPNMHLKKLPELSRHSSHSLARRYANPANRCEGQGSTRYAREPTIRLKNRPILCTNASFGVVAESMKDFLGCVNKVEMEATEAEVKTVEQFRLEIEEDTKIVSVCPLDDGEYMWVSCSRFGLNKEMPCRKFHMTGRLCLKSKSAIGRGSFKSIGSGESLFAEESQSLRLTYSKSQRDQHIKLSNYLKGTASVKTVKVTSEDPFDTEEFLESKIKVGPHSAFDADSSGQFYVVIEEVKNPDTQRMVRLYRRNQEDAVATYSSPIDNFQPSDVCFYQLGGKEVLIVADEGSSRLHVVEVGDTKMDFKRFLDLACPLLVQPTALNTDTKGRLWVACGWGAILTMTPIV